jgi:molybdopterin converting factor small subunit
MPVMIELSSMYLSLTDNQRTVPVEATTVADALVKLTAKHGKLNKELYNGRGEKKENISIYVNSRDIAAMDGVGTKVQNGDVVTIVPSVGYGRKWS